MFGKATRSDASKPDHITTRDGKELDIDLTLAMAQDIIDHNWNTHAERGLAMALEAALWRLNGEER